MYDVTHGFFLGDLSEKRVLREVLSNSFLGYAEIKPPNPAQNPLEWNYSFFFRLETAPPEHRLWELPGQWSLPTHRVRHRWQAEGEDGGGVPAHEEPCLWAPGKFSGLYHVSTSWPWTAFEMLVFFHTWELSDQLSTHSLVPAVFYAASWMKRLWLHLEVSKQLHCVVKGFCSQGACAPLVQLLGCLPLQYWFSLLEVPFIFVPCVKCSWFLNTVVLQQNIGMPCMCITAVAC